MVEPLLTAVTFDQSGLSHLCHSNSHEHAAVWPSLNIATRRWTGAGAAHLLRCCSQSLRETASGLAAMHLPKQTRANTQHREKVRILLRFLLLVGRNSVDFIPSTNPHSCTHHCNQGLEAGRTQSTAVRPTTATQAQQQP